MEEYSAWTVIQSKWPLLVVLVAVILSVITVRVIVYKKQNKAEKE